MKKLLFIIFIIIHFSVSAQTENETKIIFEANEAYKNNDFALAIEKYDYFLQNNVESAELYYNLGNSYFKQNDIAKAILYYERALRLSPNDENIIYNLEHANLFVQDEFTEVPDFFLDKIFNSILNFFGSDIWAVISIITFVLALGIFLIFLFSKIVIRRKLAFFGAIILIVFTQLSFIFSYQTKKNIVHSNYAIIMQISTIKSSPENDGTEIFILNPGVKVKVESQNNDYYEVKLPNGKVGWILKKLIEIV